MKAGRFFVRLFCKYEAVDCLPFSNSLQLCLLRSFLKL